jgi:peptide subunit release factor 1 (eRF1)
MEPGSHQLRAVFFGQPQNDVAGNTAPHDEHRLWMQIAGARRDGRCETVKLIHEQRGLLVAGRDRNDVQPPARNDRPVCRHGFSARHAGKPSQGSRRSILVHPRRHKGCATDAEEKSMLDTSDSAVQVLLDHRTGRGMIVSCYADTTVTDGFQSLWSQHLKNETAAIERRLSDDAARARFATDIDLIRDALGTPTAHRARGMAVFSAAEQNLFYGFPLGVPVKDRLVLDEEPYLVPLLETMHRQRLYLVVLTDSHRSRLYEAAWGHARLSHEMEENVPRRQRGAGEQWGKQQATIARHRENQLLRYRKRLAAAIEKAWRRAPFRGLILLGDDETIRVVRAKLPAVINQQVARTGPYCWSRGEPTVDESVQEVLDETFRAHDARLEEELNRRFREHCLIAAGPQEVVNALRNGQVGYPGFLILEPDRGEMATRCRGCGSLFITMADRCAFCHCRCDKVNLWQEVLFFAARHNITAHIVESHPELSRHGGIAAALFRAEPWEAGGDKAMERKEAPRDNGSLSARGT